MRCVFDGTLTLIPFVIVTDKAVIGSSVRLDVSERLHKVDN